MGTEKEIKTNFEMVKEFHEKFGMMVHEKPTDLTSEKLQERYDFMLEELTEFKNAIEPRDMAGLADALVDIVYVAMGTAVQMGLPWEELFSDVQRANMAKVRGITKRGVAVDCMKPEGWVPPKTQDILDSAGYVPLAAEEYVNDAKYNELKGKRNELHAF